MAKKITRINITVYTGIKLYEDILILCQQLVRLSVLLSSVIN